MHGCACVNFAARLGRRALQKWPCAEALCEESLELQGFEVFAEGGAEFLIEEGELDGGFQEAEFVARIVGNSFVNVSPQALLFGEEAQAVSELDFAAGAGLGAFQAIEDGGRENVTPGDGEIRGRFFGWGLFDEITDAQQAFAEGRDGRGFAVNDAVEMGFLVRHFFNGDGAGAGGFVDVDELLGGGIFAGDENIAEENGEGLVAHEILGDQDGVAEAEGFLLAGVADLDHVGDAANEFGQRVLALLFEILFEDGRAIEMILDGIFALAGDDDDVLDAGGHALFGDVLDLRLVHDGEHFLGLGLGGGKETRAEARGGQNGFANFLMAGGNRLRLLRVFGHREFEMRARKWIWNTSSQ